MTQPHQTYDGFMQNLLPEQKDAVETIYGPVMIIAGPGTGKTRILSLRIGNILTQLDCDPWNILCLTYTDAAAAEMRERLIQLYNVEAYQIHVHTFHGFCNLVIREHPEYFTQAKELEPISKLDKFKLLKQLIDSFPHDHPLKKVKGQIYYNWTRLDNLFELMKKENLSPAYMLARIEEYKEAKKEEYRYKRGKVGELKPSYQTDVVDRMNVLSHGVAAFEEYNALLQSQGKYTFEDMLQWVIKAFTDHPSLLEDYQEKFQFILVDEFQDTNGAQLEILHRLISHEWVDQPNVFVVGDDDQSIYRFQGASLSNMTGFNDEFKPKTILFSRNHRSTQKILNAADEIMAPVDERLKIKYTSFEKLEAKAPWATEETPVRLLEFNTDELENAFIFNQLKEWHSNKKEGSVAVLFKQHIHGAGIAQALQGAGIPFTIQKQINVLEIPFVKDLLRILKALDAARDVITVDDALLFQILHLPYLGISPRDLQLAVLDYTRVHPKDRANFFLFLSQPGWLASSALADKTSLQNVIDIFHDGGKLSYSVTLPYLLEWTIQKFGIIDWILQQPEKMTWMTALKTIYTFIERETKANKGFDIRQFLHIIDDMETYNLELTIQNLTTPTTSGIILSTLHGSKGLEFDHVYIMALTEGQWEKKREPNHHFSYPDNLVSSTALEADSKINDLRRLLYVGMTRARRQLTISCYDKDSAGKEQIPSMLLRPLHDKPSLVEISNPEPDDDILLEYEKSFMSGNLTPNLHIDETEIQSRIKNFILNPSALNDYLECPLRFYYAKILSIPSFQTPALRFGSALHAGLEYYFQKKFNEKIEETNLSNLLSSFEYAMRKDENFFIPGEYDGLIRYGREILTGLYEAESQNWRDDVQYLLEHRLENIEVEGVPVKGFIDRIDKDKDKLVVTDYKSGRSDSLPSKIKRPDEKNPNGGSYWRQIVFYDLMLQADPRFRKPADLYFIQALEPDSGGKFPKRTVAVGEQDRDFLRNLIRDTFAKIQAQEFHQACGSCDWCRMHNITTPNVDPSEAE